MFFHHFTRALLKAGPDLVAIAVFTLLWFAMVLLYGGKIHLVEGSILLPSYIAGFFIFSATIKHYLFRKSEKNRPPLWRRILVILRGWLPLIYLVMVYETLRDYTGLIRPDYIDEHLLKLDLLIFGVEPTVWIQKFENPFLTDYFTLMYVLYIVLPMAVAGFLWKENRIEDFREVALGCVLCMYTGFFLYIIFPAGPPRFYEGLVFDPPVLKGIFGLYEFTHDQMNRSSYVLHRASFPSLHVALSVLGSLQAYRFRNLRWGKTIFAVTLWITMSIAIATVYLRHHWTVDIFAGALLAFLAFELQKRIRRGWDYLSQRYA